MTKILPLDYFRVEDEESEFEDLAVRRGMTAPAERFWGSRLKSF